MIITPESLKTIKLTNNIKPQTMPIEANSTIKAMFFDPVAALAAAAPVVSAPAVENVDTIFEPIADVLEQHTLYTDYTKTDYVHQEYKTATLLTATNLLEVINEEIDLINNAFFNLSLAFEPILIEDTFQDVVSDKVTFSTASHVASLQSVLARLSVIRRKINILENRSAL